MDTNIITKKDVEDIKKRAKRGQVREALQILAEKHGDMVTPYDVLDEARDEKSVLHHLFEWDDTVAGEKYRLMQSRVVLNTVKITYNGEPRDAFYNVKVKIGGTETRGYFSLQRVVSDEEVHKAVLRQAIAEMEYAQKKYETLKEMKGVINTKKLKKIKESVAE